MKTYHYIIKGRVQGVFYRYRTHEAAERYLIRGTVKNLPSGEVEVFAQGEPRNIESFEQFLNQGPPASRVEEVCKKISEHDNRFSGFKIIY